jgi:hypothetical protein
MYENEMKSSPSKTPENSAFLDHGAFDETLTPVFQRNRLYTIWPHKKFVLILTFALLDANTGGWCKTVKWHLCNIR